MKRCPQCEFIYEDDQSLCDMDGVLLVFDSRTLPNLHALATVSAPMPGRTSRRNRMVPAFATLILMIAVASVYFISTTRTAVPANFEPASVTTSTAETPAPTPAEAPVAVPTPSAEPDRSNETQPADSQPKPTAPAATRNTTTKPATTKPASKKDDSKVGSILKKTGKILKKPFKF